MINVLNPRMEDFARASGLTALTMTGSVTPDSYRADDREGCLDTVHAIAARAVDRALNGGAS